MDLSGPGVFQLHPPRADITAREVCRSGGVLRLLQEAAVADSVRRGWDPLRYRQEQTGFIIYKARLVQRREIPSGPALTARTWVLDFRRGTLSRRLIHLLGSDGELLVEALQEWAHITLPELSPARAPSALLEAFSPSHEPPSPPESIRKVRLPIASEIRWTTRIQTLELWNDPYRHLNHPYYLDCCEEALWRALRAQGEDPHQLVLLGSELRWRQGLRGGEPLDVDTRILGRDPSGRTRSEHRLSTLDGQPLATILCDHRLVDSAPEQLTQVAASHAQTL